MEGYAFFWPAWSYSPWLEHPSTGEKIWLKVRDFVPYLDVPDGDAIPRTWEAESRGDRHAAAVGRIFADGFADDAAAEIELIRARLVELYSKESTKVAMTGLRAASQSSGLRVASPAAAGDYWRVSNYMGDGDPISNRWRRCCTR